MKKTVPKLRPRSEREISAAPDATRQPCRSSGSTLSARQRYLLRQLSEAGFLKPLLDNLKRNIELATKKLAAKA
jgi:hypothetical protein